MRSGQMADRLGAEIVIDHLERRIGVPQAFDDRCAQLAAHRIGTQNAAVDVQEFHGSCPWQKIVLVRPCEHPVSLRCRPGTRLKRRFDLPLGVLGLCRMGLSAPPKGEEPRRTLRSDGISWATTIAMIGQPENWPSRIDAFMIYACGERTSASSAHLWRLPSTATSRARRSSLVSRRRP